MIVQQAYYIVCTVFIYKIRHSDMNNIDSDKLKQI